MKISERGQITVPKALRAKFGLNKDVDIELVPVKDGILIQKSTKSIHPVEKVIGILNQSSKSDEIIEKMRGR